MAGSDAQFKWVALTLLFLNLFFCMVATVAVPPLFPEILGEIPLTKAQMGLVMGITTLASLIFAPLGGGLGDKFGVRWIVAVGALLIAVAGGMRAMVGSASTLVACMFFLGGGQAVLCAVMPKVLSTWFPQQQLAQANGICFSSLGLGTAVAMATSATVLSPQLGGWRTTMLVLGAISLAASLLWVLLYRDRTGIAAPAADTVNVSDNFKKLLQVREIRLIAVFYGLVMISLMSIITLLPIILQERGIENAGGMVSILLTCSFLFNILGGMISDWFGRRKPFLIIGALICAASLPAFVFCEGLLLMLALGVAGAAVGTTAPILLTLPIELKQVGTALAGTAGALIMMIGNTSGFLGPVITGKLIDVTGSHLPGFALLVAAFLLAAIIMLPLKEPARAKTK